MMNIKRKEQGFTLIELMIVVAIIGILAAIAIPQFAKYRQKAFNSAAESDLRNVMTAEEAAFADTQKYANDRGSQGAGAGVTGPNTITGLDSRVSNNVSVRINTDTNGKVYAVFAGHSKGTKVYGGDSSGQIQYKASSTPDTTATGQTGTDLSGFGGTNL